MSGTTYRRPDAHVPPRLQGMNANLTAEQADRQPVWAIDADRHADSIAALRFHVERSGVPVARWREGALRYR